MSIMARWSVVDGNTLKAEPSGPLVLYEHAESVIADQQQELRKATAMGYQIVLDYEEQLDAMRETTMKLFLALTTAHDAMCQASFIVGKRKSDLNHAIDVARRALNLYKQPVDPDPAGANDPESTEILYKARGLEGIKPTTDDDLDNLPY